MGKFKQSGHILPSHNFPSIYTMIFPQKDHKTSFHTKNNKNLDVFGRYRLKICKKCPNFGHFGIFLAAALWRSSCCHHCWRPKPSTGLRNFKKRGAIYTAFYDEEVLAMEMAVEWLSTNKPTSGPIVTDSQSLCEALQGLDPNLDPLRQKIKTQNSLSPFSGSQATATSLATNW